MASRTIVTEYRMRNIPKSATFSNIRPVYEGSQVKASCDMYTQGSYSRSYSTSLVARNYSASYEARVIRGDIGDVYDEYYLQLIQVIYYPPSTPSSITVPTEIKGGDIITISWGSASGATRYYLERSVDGGTWTSIYNGTTLNYKDSIVKGWSTVAYRVKAYNSDGYSSYRTSSTIKVINFPEFNIKVDGMLKTSENGWAKINGALREINSIHIKIDGILKEV